MAISSLQLSVRISKYILNQMFIILSSASSTIELLTKKGSYKKNPRHIISIRIYTLDMHNRPLHLDKQ